MSYEYRINAKLRRRGQSAFPSNIIEFCSEQYDDDESMCAALASEMLEQIKADREYQQQRDDGLEDEDN